MTFGQIRLFIEKLNLYELREEFRFIGDVRIAFHADNKSWSKITNEFKSGIKGLR